MTMKNEDVKRLCTALSDFVMLLVEEWAGGDDLRSYPIDAILKVLDEQSELVSNKNVSKSDLMTVKDRVNAFNDIHVMIAKALKVRKTLLDIADSTGTSTK